MATKRRINPYSESRNQQIAWDIEDQDVERAEERLKLEEKKIKAIEELGRSLTGIWMLLILIAVALMVSCSHLASL